MEPQGRSREDQYAWLKGIVDPASSLEKEFLDFLYEHGYRLPDTAQNRPEPSVPSQPDFYYERGAAPGVCVFVDGAVHDEAGREELDQSARAILEDKGYRVIVIRFDQDFDQQVTSRPDVFGAFF